MFCMSKSFSSQCLISFSNGLIKGEPFIVWVLTMWSSSMAWISSTEDRIVKPVSLYLAVLKHIGSQSACILIMAFSKLNSLVAAADTTSNSAM